MLAELARNAGVLLSFRKVLCITHGHIQQDTLKRLKVVWAMATT